MEPIVVVSGFLDNIGRLDMFMTRLASYAFAFALAFANFDPALAFPVSAGDIGASAPAPQLELVRGGYRGGGVRRGGYAVRGGGVRVGGVGRGVYRGGYRAGYRGAYRVGGRYYGGVWYGAGRRWYGGRWWPYGVGACWRASPIGYVWICG